MGLKAWTWLIAGASAAGAHIGDRAVWAAEFEDYRTVPYLWAQDLSRFAALFEAARTQTVRIALIGDSQETTPSGAGAVYVPQLNYQAFQYYGNVPETMVGGCSYYGASDVPSEWLLAGANDLPAPITTRLAPDQLLPGITAASHRSLSGSLRGQLTMLLPNATGLVAGAGIPTDVQYFPTDGTVTARVFAATHADSGEIYYRVKPTNASMPDYGAAVTAEGLLPLGLQSSVPLAVKSGLTPPLDLAGKRYLQIELAGDSGDKLTDILGIQYLNQTHPQGMVFHRLAAGGYTAARFLESHANAGAFFSAMDFDAVFLHLGANDADRLDTAGSFKTDVEALIRQVRTWTGNDQFKFILSAETDRVLWTATKRSEYAQYAGALLDIAMHDENVMILNSRRLMADVGWFRNSTHFHEYVDDLVHYTPLGATRLAEAEFAAMQSITTPGEWRLVVGSESLPAGSGTAKLKGLSLLREARLDLVGNDLILDPLPGTQGDVFVQVSTWVAEGRICSSPDDNPYVGLGVVLNGMAAGGMLAETFGGYEVDATAVLVRRTWHGDANLDGVVDADDYFQIDTGYVWQIGWWYNGDFNYDGVVDADDYFLIDSAFISQHSSLNAIGFIPEPGCVWSLLAAALGILTARRRR